MASASVVDHLESLPLVDLRLLSQSELYSLSLCSSLSSSSFSSTNANDAVLIPKIDRSVFNESAGSRKQTYSRLRLAPRKPQTPSSTTATTTAPSSSFLRHSINTAEPIAEENYQIISLLKQLFASESPALNYYNDNDDNLFSVHVEYKDSLPLPDSSNSAFRNLLLDYQVQDPLPNAVLQNVPIDVVFDQKRKRGRPRKSDSWMIQRKPEPKADQIVPKFHSAASSGKKRKRGRPRKENFGIENKPVVDNVEGKEMVNKNGDVVDVAALRNVDGPYGEELKRRTEGLRTEEELLGFLRGLNGEWGSRRKKRRIVQACDFGDALPTGWKLMLSLKKKAGIVWLHCRRYISPNGQQFVSCKEVSSYLLSFFGLQDAGQPRSGHTDDNFQLASKMDSKDEADLTLEDGENADDLVSCSPLPMTSILTDSEKQNTLKTSNPGVETGGILKCHKCALTFDEKNDLVHHLLSCHKSTANGCKRGTSISDGVIIKDGKFECQFCHKIFDERHRYNGHIGVHVKNYVKSVEAPGVTSMQKSIDPVKMHASVGIDMAKMSDVEAIDELSLGFLHGEIKADSIFETCSHEPVLLSHGEQAIKDEKTHKALLEEYSVKHNRTCNLNNDNLGKVDEYAAVVDSAVRLLDETAPKNENKSICESSDETNVIKCISTGIDNCVAESRCSESCSVAPSGNETTCVFGNNVTGVSVCSLEESKLEIRSESGLLALNGKDKTCSSDNIEDRCFPSTVEGMEVGSDKLENNESISGFGNHCSMLKDVWTNVQQQCSSEGCSSFPFGNEQSCSFINNGNGILRSFMLDSVQEGGSGIGLCSPPTDEKMCLVSNNVSTITLDEPKFDEVSISGDNVIRAGFGSNHASQNKDVVTSSKLDGSSGSLISSRNELCSVENSANKNPHCTVEEPWREKSSESNVFAPSVDEQRSGFDNNVNKISAGTMEGFKFDEVRNCKNGELYIAFDRIDSRVNADTVACSEQEGRAKGCLQISSADEHKHVSNNYEICNSTMEELKQIRESSESGLLSQSGYEENCDITNTVNNVSSSSIKEAKHKEVKSSWNSEPFLAFGTQAGLDADVTSTMQGQTSADCSAVLSTNELTFSTENNLSGVYGSAVRELKHKKGFKNGFPCPSDCEQIENKLNRHTSALWEQPRVEDMEKHGNDELMIGFGNHAQTNEDVMAELIWRTEEQNVQQSGSADTSSPLMQSSGCFPNSDIMSNKGGNEIFSINERFDSISGLEGLRTSSLGHMEYDFLTRQASSHPEESKVLTYDVETEQGFDSSAWLKKEALPLLPKLASRHQVRTVCVWCGIEFYQESVNSEIQSDSVGFMCGTCKTKFSGQINLL